MEQAAPSRAGQERRPSNCYPCSAWLTAQLRSDPTRHVVVGPAGSGEQLKQESVSYVDGLVHGKRRWLFIGPESFVALRDEAKEVIEPASAFMFFEQQYGELKEDFGMGSKGKRFWECTQTRDFPYSPRKPPPLSCKSSADSASMDRVSLQAIRSPATCCTFRPRCSGSPSHSRTRSPTPSRLRPPVR